MEAVTTAFFDEYRRVFDLAMERVEGFSDDEDEQESKKLFVQTLFNRLMFVYFLSRKGWLTFKGDTDNLNALWRDCQDSPDQDNFYRWPPVSPVLLRPQQPAVPRPESGRDSFDGVRRVRRRAIP